MNRLALKLANLSKRKDRIRSIVKGTADRPRLNVFVSNRHITAQLIDDSNHSTLVYASTVGQKSLSSNKKERAEWVGEQIGKKAKSAKINRVVFDRGGKLYHGRVKVLADAAREQGLEF